MFSVTQETWRLADDPAHVAPQTEVIASRRTAADAADIARGAAAAFRRHGFHKPSGCWWGADDLLFYRFVVRAGPPRAAVALAVGASLAGLAVFLFNRKRRRHSSSQTGASSAAREPPSRRARLDRRHAQG